MISTTTLLELQNPDGENLFQTILGPTHGSLHQVVDIETLNEKQSFSSSTLGFVATHENLTKALRMDLSGVIVAKRLLETLSLPTGLKGLWLSTPNIKEAMAAVLPFFSQKLEMHWVQTSDVSPLAYVHPSAKIGAHVQIQAFAWIGPEVTLGAKTKIGAHAVIQGPGTIGEGSIIHPQAYIGPNTEIGSYCEIMPQACIGSEGFGFATSKKFEHHRIPQIGGVILGDRVRISSQTTVDRATLGYTRVGSGTKLDAHCHLGHNCELGENSLAAGGFLSGGSSKFGKRFVGGGAAVAADHVHVTDDVVVAGRSAITNDVTTRGEYGGYPLQSLRDSLKNLAQIPNLVKMRRQIQKILKHLNLDAE